MAKVSTGTRIASGRAGDVSFAAPGLIEFLRDASQALKGFDLEMRKAAQEVAQHVVDRAIVNANAQPPQGKPRDGSSGHSQASQVARALRARRDRIPTIKLDHKRGFVSASRPNRGRKTKVTMGDVFYGAEFGGRRRKTTMQFPRHRGRQGYFFWQAVRDNKSFIVKEYSDAIERVLKNLAKGAQ
jgi:hypothetical protein